MSIMIDIVSTVAIFCCMINGIIVHDVMTASNQLIISMTFTLLLSQLEMPFICGQQNTPLGLLSSNKHQPDGSLEHVTLILMHTVKLNSLT